MSNITPFSFESHSVRVITDEKGELWFVAADVCEALTLSTEQTRRLDDDEKGLRTVQTPGGQQEMVAINESGLYSLILTSRKPEAKRFKKWVTSEVLPSIRKTGSYETPQKKRSLPHTRTMELIQSTADLLLRIVPDLDRKILAVQTVETIRRNTGLDVMPMQATFGDTAEQVPLLTVTQIGKDTGYSARSLNTWLEEHRYIVKADNGDWATTKLGESLGGKMVPYEAPNGHAGYRVLWSKQAASTIRELVEVAPGSSKAA